MRSWLVAGILFILLVSVAHASTVLVSQDPVTLAIKAGNHYAKKGEYATALDWFDKAIELNPLSAIAHHNKGVVYHEMKQSSEAIASFQNAIEADVSYAKAHYSLALEYYYQGNNELSIEELNKVTQLEPNNANAHFDLGVILVEQFRKTEDTGRVAAGDLDTLRFALSHYKEVVSIDPKFPHAIENADIVENVLNDYMQ